MKHTEHMKMNGLYGFVLYLIRVEVRSRVVRISNWVLVRYR
jgi:hypothetical protein